MSSFYSILSNKDDKSVIIHEKESLTHAMKLATLEKVTYG